MSDAKRYQFATLGCVELALFVEELVHIHALQLGDALLLRHLLIELVNLLLYVDSGVTACY